MNTCLLAFKLYRLYLRVQHVIRRFARDVRCSTNRKRSTNQQTRPYISMQVFRVEMLELSRATVNYIQRYVGTSACRTFLLKREIGNHAHLLKSIRRRSNSLHRISSCTLGRKYFDSGLAILALYKICSSSSVRIFSFLLHSRTRVLCTRTTLLQRS